MAAKTDQLLIVVSILEGRHFPKSPRLSLVVQASFDGEQLATDPVEHREQPRFSTELAWELDRRTLHQHRLQRTPIKLQCFAVDAVSRKRDGVGYIVLDLRSVQEVKQEPRWYPLLSSRYTKQRPALLLGLALEGDAKPPPPPPDRFRAKEAPPRQGASSVSELLPEQLEAVLVPDQGFHQVGPAELGSDMFLLSVTVAFATRLEQLVPGTSRLSAEDSGFFFYYSLLGNDITSEPFGSLLSPDFQPERASVRIRSSKQILLAFLSQQPSLQVHLCCGSRSLGSTEVSLSALAALPVDLDSRAATVEGAFVLRPPKRVQLPALPPDLQPTVGVAVSLRREDAPPQSVRTKVSSDAPPESAPPESAPPESAPPESAPPDSAPPDSAPPAEQRRGSSSPVVRPAEPPPPPSSHTESEAASLLEELQELREPAGVAGGVRTPDAEAVPSGWPDAAGEAGASSASVSAPKVSIPASAHHYCFSLDLSSLGGLSLPHPINATLRYRYRFFGSSAPISTSPPVELHRGTEMPLPQSFCAFDFAAPPQQLQDTFLRVPLLVELWHRGSCSRDELIGRASIQLSRLLGSDRTMAAAPERRWRQQLRERVPVLRANSPAEKVAELTYTATLDDLGFISQKEVILSPSSQSEAPPPSPPAAPPSRPPPPPVAPRDTLEYRTALELELWKEEQEDLFDDQLKKKELRHMQALAEEWRRRDREREALVQKKEVEFGQLEERLQKTLLDLEKREKQLAEAELQTQRLQKELRAEHELTQRQLQEASSRLQRDSDHRVALELHKVQLMEEERARLLQQIADGEARCKQLEKEFQLYREQQNVRPEFRLQSQINLLTLEKVELERKLESTTKSKLHYKQQWGRALKELARYKQREQDGALGRLRRQQAELEALRLRLLASEEQQAVRQDQQELDHIRNQINSLKPEERLGPASSGSAPSYHAPSGPAPTGPAPSGLQLSGSAEEHLSRLLEERDTLLRTGVYTHQDRIISQLSRQIQDAMAPRATP